MTLFGSRSPRKPVPGYSVVDDRLTVRGDLETDDTVRVDGRVEGVMHRAGTLIVGVGGTVVGNIDAREVHIAGTVQGDVHASGRVEIEVGATVLGAISASTMVLREGATVHGQVSIGAPRAVAAASPAGMRLELAPSPVPSGRALG